MDTLDRILDRFTDPSTGSLHGAVFIVVDRSGTVTVIIPHLILQAVFHIPRILLFPSPSIAQSNLLASR